MVNSVQSRIKRGRVKPERPPVGHQAPVFVQAALAQGGWQQLCAVRAGDGDVGWWAWMG